MSFNPSESDKTGTGRTFDDVLNELEQGTNPVQIHSEEDKPVFGLVDVQYHSDQTTINHAPMGDYAPANRYWGSINAVSLALKVLRILVVMALRVILAILIIRVMLAIPIIRGILIPIIRLIRATPIIWIILAIPIVYTILKILGDIRDYIDFL